LGFYVLLGLLFLLSKNFSTHKKIPDNIWIIIYSLIFMPSLVSLITAARNMSA
jgi:hypothetical protein